MERKALIAFSHTTWSGWHPDGFPITTSTRVRAAAGQTLSPATIGYTGAQETAMSYEVLVDRVYQDRVAFRYKGLVPENPGGGINLGAERTGHFMLLIGQSKRLSTPTMDAGVGVTIALENISIATEHP